MNKNEQINIIISGGGTGGHVFPAISIADTTKEHFKNANILFIGSDNRLETTAVPKAGYAFEALPIRGLQRKISFKIFDTFFRLIKSIRISRKIIKKFKPDIVVGVGGYASAAVMHVATKKGIPTLIQEQNSFPGITNKMLAKKVSAICVAYEEMDKFFPADKLFVTGNPIRNLKSADVSKDEALNFFGLDKNKKTLFITGGSLGAKTINSSVIHNFNDIQKANIQLIWQTGKRYYEEVREFIEKQTNTDGIVVTKFIDRMDLAYKSADLVISRAGAITISELALLGKAVVFVPSPNVAEDHQTKNAEALVKLDAAVLIKDKDAKENLLPTAIKTINNSNKINKLSENISAYAKPNASNEILKIIKKITIKK
ncbi:MAG: undecaprenyldiphospho-muramoylpentapeptide beta-N-acetylglucosaminyltransferase [Bacteroidota bacterium]|nr:undecaprenyldiphospho-muramoylpentapeptide beta-N-acetylglucosaminyltransferase [Bacteroidota bacterium]